MGWDRWIRTVEIEPAIDAAEAGALEHSVESLLRTGCKLVHLNGGAVESRRVSAAVASLAPVVHRLDGVLDVHVAAGEFGELAAAGADSITFDNRKQPNKPIGDQGYIHGDGVLVYPGEEKLHPDEDRGLPGPVATIQLANLRRGLQDHQYLTLARHLGLTAEIDVALRAIVPRVFSEAGPSVSFPETGDPYEKVRLSLARAIVAARSRPSR